MSTASPPPADDSAFHAWYATQGIRHFSAAEFTSYFHVHRRGVTNSPPPRDIWANILPTIRIVDQLRDHFRSPITLLSSYRSKAYNAAIGDAAPLSQHLQFRALDISVRNYSPRTVFNLLRDWRAKGKFTGGLGLYPTFVHIDTRGTNATWGI